MVRLVSSVKRKLVPDALSQTLSASRYEALLHLSSDWYWEKDAQHRFTYLSRGFASSGAVARDYIGKPRWEIPGLEAASGWEAHRATLDARLPYRDVLFAHMLKDGERRYSRASGEPIFDAEGTFTGYRGTSRDVTEQRRAEELLGLEHEITRALVAGEDIFGTLQAVLRMVCESEHWECGACAVVAALGICCSVGSNGPYFKLAGSRACAEQLVTRQPRSS